MGSRKYLNVRASKVNTLPRVPKLNTYLRDYLSMSVCTFQLKPTYIKLAVWGPHLKSSNKCTSCKTVFPGYEVPGYKDCLCKKLDF